MHEQIPLLRRQAGAESAGDVLPPGGAYDLVNDVMSFGMHRRWKRQTVRLALAGRRLRGGDGLLDLCCGTGDMAFWRRTPGRAASGDGRRLHAPDAGRRAPPKRRELRRSSAFVQADALRLPFPRRDASTPSRSATACATSPTPHAAIARDAPRARAGRPRRRPRLRQARQPPRRALYQALSPDHDAGRRLALPRRPRDLSLHPRVSEALSRRSAASSA